MKKISTLAVALITMGSLAMPAWADVVPTEIKMRIFNHMPTR